jgi:hypothetical protein
MYKPKATRDIYVESLSINSASLEKQLAEQSLQPGEIRNITGEVAKMYNENVDRIVQECDRDMIALENAPSPLKLFIDCLTKAQELPNVSPPARALIQRYMSAWEDWM